MIRKVNSFLYALLYCAIYFSAQLLVVIIPLAAIALSKLIIGETDSADIVYYISGYGETLQKNSHYLIAAAAVVSLLFYHIILKKRGLAWRDALDFKRLKLKELSAAIFLAYGLNVAASLIMSLRWLMPFRENYKTVMDSILSGNIWALFWIVGIMAPVFEELLYRGLILRELEKSMSFFFANLFQALIFGAMHGNVIQGLYAAVIGFALGYAYRLSKTIYIVMLIHILLNASNVLVAEYVGGSIEVPYFIISGAAALAIGFLLIRRK